MRISDWSSDVCSSDLLDALRAQRRDEARVGRAAAGTFFRRRAGELRQHLARRGAQPALGREERLTAAVPRHAEVQVVAFEQRLDLGLQPRRGPVRAVAPVERSEEHTSELQSLMRISYAVFCLKKKTTAKHK